MCSMSPDHELPRHASRCRRDELTLAPEALAGRWVQILPSRALDAGVLPVLVDVAGARLAGGGPSLVAEGEGRALITLHHWDESYYQQRTFSKSKFQEYHPSKSCPHLDVAGALSEQALHAGLAGSHGALADVAVVGTGGAGAHRRAAAVLALHAESKAFRRCQRRACGLPVASASPAGSPQGRGCRRRPPESPQGRSRKTR